MPPWPQAQADHFRCHTSQSQPAGRVLLTCRVRLRWEGAGAPGAGQAWVSHGPLNPPPAPPGPPLAPGRQPVVSSQGGAPPLARCPPRCTKWDSAVQPWRHGPRTKRGGEPPNQRDSGRHHRGSTEMPTAPGGVAQALSTAWKTGHAQRTGTHPPLLHGSARAQNTQPGTRAGIHPHTDTRHRHTLMRAHVHTHAPMHTCGTSRGSQPLWTQFFTLRTAAAPSGAPPWPRGCLQGGAWHGQDSQRP